MADCSAVVAQTDLDATEVCVIFARSIRINSGLQVSGERPLVIVAAEALDVDVDLDVSGRAGATEDYVACSEANSGRASGAGGSGGAGGSFGGYGGNGGDSDSLGSLVLGGRADLEPPVVGVVRGGCRGGGGGVGTVAGGVFGAAGRSICLIAGTTLTISATIDASGAGGGGGMQSGSSGGGGGGGGSGGQIVVDAPTIVLGANAKLVANGGGGGGGGGGNSAGATAGEVGGRPFVNLALGGAAGTPNATAGGDGGSAAKPSANQGGAGGGGGGVGSIKVFTTTLQRDAAAVSSPEFGTL